MLPYYGSTWGTVPLGVHKVQQERKQQEALLTP